MLVDEKGRGIRYKDPGATSIYRKNVRILHEIYEAEYDKLCQHLDIKCYTDKIVEQGKEMAYYEPWKALAKAFPDYPIDLGMFKIANQRYLQKDKVTTEIKYWQINAIKQYGSTIISRDLDADYIVSFFRSIGIEVSVREERHDVTMWVVEDQEMLRRRYNATIQR